MQPQVVEQEVQAKVLTADFEVELPADKGETDAKLKQEPLQVLEQPALKLAPAASSLRPRKSRL
jgi:hypothetical protein